MGIWAEIKHALNSTLGTKDFKPLDKQITDRIGLIPDENIYTSQYLAPNTTVQSLFLNRGIDRKPTTRELSSMSLSVNTQGQVNLKTKGSITCVQNVATNQYDFAITIYAVVSIFKNNELLYSYDQRNLGALTESTVGTPRTFTFTLEDSFSSGFINKGDKITAKIDIIAVQNYNLYTNATCTQSNITFEVYGKTVIIDPTLFKTEIREETE